ncbi:hypothetical protein ACVDG3_01470 [Meridianimarinicoccus sp. RP-17]|uniref:hypothetical protein n=1 Tax=Meridianimarinicoccus zhengii TaxID=2056810 RepID=UPI000DAF3350|nr:hypothetical protein [Phycocomes zhengii]
MTRVLAPVRAGVVLSDQGTDRTNLLDVPGGGRRTFSSATSAAGLAAPTTNTFTLLETRDGGVYAGDGNADAVTA